ncbi:MAG: YncE family protein [Bacteroidales bacterium]|nr:YncE family protein [Bacteroidales bacterium]
MVRVTNLLRVSIFAMLLPAMCSSILSCRKMPEFIKSTTTSVTDGSLTGSIKGFYLLNEGNMGSNKATLDYFDYQSGVYTKNIFAERNPGVVKELGDVGNDLQIYGDKLYAVINCSHFVEVMDAQTAKHITQISIPNCRYITFKERFAYVSSYAGPVELDPNSRLGYVAKIDTLTLKVVDSCVVGYQPEQMIIVGSKMYVANSGGYRAPNYDTRVSVIDLNSFKVIKNIEVGINLHRMAKDRWGNIYVSSRGDYYNTPSMTYVIDSNTDSVESLPLLPNSDMAICGDSLYIYSAQWNYLTNRNTIDYAIYNLEEKRVVTRSFIKEGAEKQIKTPYGIALNPESGEIFVADAKDYVTPGSLYCFDASGRLKWSVTTGDVPAHIAFTTKPLKPL